MAKTNSPLNNKGIDAVQSFKKVYDDTLEAHRTTEIKEPFNKVEYSYNACNRITTVSYFYDSVAEISNVSFIADCCSNLCGKSFVVFSANDAKQYRPYYIVCCGTTAPASSTTVKYIPVNIVACDAAVVVALATKNAFEANACAPCDFTFALSQSCLTITNSTKGASLDAADVDAGFTVTTNTQGARTTVDVLTYTYDLNGRLCSITSQTGEHIIDLSEVVNNSIEIIGNGNITKVTESGDMHVYLSEEDKSMLYNINDNLKRLVLHMQTMTDEEFNSGDIDG
jgi:YD repeat-containing protein